MSHERLSLHNIDLECMQVHIVSIVSAGISISLTHLSKIINFILLVMAAPSIFNVEKCMCLEEGDFCFVLFSNDAIR